MTAPSDTPPIFRHKADLRRCVAQWRGQGNTIGLVPTMGALHRGHLALVSHALERCGRVVVSIFVNPTQFGPNEDLTAYPRRETQDIEALEALGLGGALAIWAPGVAEMYPEGFATTVAVAGLTKGLCGAFRPGHFEGVATVVAKLLNQVQPDRAFFGEKDYQQLQVIRRMATDLDLPVEISGVPTVREPDGLALSSRNLYLSGDERRRAVILPTVLDDVAQDIAAGKNIDALLEKAHLRLNEAGFGPIDYVAVCDAETLEPLSAWTRPARVFAAARLGKTRLIDNRPIGSSPLQ